MKRIYLVLLILLTSLSLVAQSPDQADELTTTITDLLDEYRVPGAAVAVIRDGEVLYSEAFGVTDIEAETPVTTETLFPIGSVSKSFTALAVAQLVDAGSVDLDVPISEYVPELTLSDPEALDQITLRMLLSHTAGLTPGALPVFERYEDREGVIADLANVPIQTEPGASYAYSNRGYILAGYILEQVTGQTWEDYVRENILQPLGMESANFDSDLLTVERYALPHYFDVLRGVVPVSFFESIELSGPAGSINTNIGELTNYLLFQMGEGTYDGERLVSQEMLNTLQTEQVDRYTLGWFPLRSLNLNPFEQIDLIGHNGAFAGYNAFAAFTPGAQSGAVVLTNVDVSTGEVFTQAALVEALAYALGETFETPYAQQLQERYEFDPAQLDALMRSAQAYYEDTPPAALLGEYSSSLVGTLFIREADEGFVADLPERGIEAAELIFLADDTFVISSPLLGLTILNAEIADESVTLSQNGVMVASKGQQPETGTQTYTDEEIGFTVQLPGDLEATTEGDFTLYQVEDPSGTLGIAAGERGDDVEADVVASLRTIAPELDVEPLAVNELPGSRNWTQYVYEFDGQVYVVNTTEVDGSTVYLLAAAPPANIDPVFMTMNDMTLSFRLVE